MDPLLAVAVALGALPVMWWISQLRFASNVLFRAPIVKIANATRNKPTMVIGRVRGMGRLLTAPLSQRPCVVYEVMVEAPGDFDVMRFRQRQLLHETEARDFIVEDDSGRALVVVEGAALALNVAWLPYPAAGETSLHDALLDEHRLDPPVPHALRFTEMVLVPGERVAVFGASEHRPDPTREPRDYRSSSSWLVIRAARLSNDESVLCRG
jgi:hypothetical protein